MFRWLWGVRIVWRAWLMSRNCGVVERRYQMRWKMSTTWVDLTPGCSHCSSLTIWCSTPATPDRLQYVTLYANILLNLNSAKGMAISLSIKLLFNFNNNRPTMLRLSPNHNPDTRRCNDVSGNLIGIIPNEKKLATGTYPHSVIRKAWGNRILLLWLGQIGTICSKLFYYLLEWHHFIADCMAWSQLPDSSSNLKVTEVFFKGFVVPEKVTFFTVFSVCTRVDAVKYVWNVTSWLVWQKVFKLNILFYVMYVNSATCCSSRASYKDTAKGRLHQPRLKRCLKLTSYDFLTEGNFLTKG